MNTISFWMTDNFTVMSYEHFSIQSIPYDYHLNSDYKTNVERSFSITVFYNKSSVRTRWNIIKGRNKYKNKLD